MKYVSYYKGKTKKKTIVKIETLFTYITFDCIINLCIYLSKMYINIDCIFNKSSKLDCNY